MVAIQKLGLLLSLVSASAFAEGGITTGSVPVAHRNVVTMSVPLQGLDSQVAIEGEHVLGERVSVGLGVFASFGRNERRMDPLPDYGVDGQNNTSLMLGLAPAMRFYLTGTAPRGLWVSPRVEAGYGRSSNDFVGGDRLAERVNDSHSNTWSLGAAAVVGYSVVLEPGFTLQGGVGLGGRRESLSYHHIEHGSDGIFVKETLNYTTWSLTERLVMNVGWAF